MSDIMAWLPEKRIFGRKLNMRSFGKYEGTAYKGN